jgi:hypothetical protein
MAIQLVIMLVLLVAYAAICVVWPVFSKGPRGQLSVASKDLGTSLGCLSDLPQIQVHKYINNM